MRETVPFQLSPLLSVTSPPLLTFNVVPLAISVVTSPAIELPWPIVSEPLPTVSSPVSASKIPFCVTFVVSFPPLRLTFPAQVSFELRVVSPPSSLNSPFCVIFTTASATTFPLSRVKSEAVLELPIFIVPVTLLLPAARLFPVPIASIVPPMSEPEPVISKYDPFSRDIVPLLAIEPALIEPPVLVSLPSTVISP